MNHHQILRHHLALAQVEGIGGILHRQLILHFKDPIRVWEAKPSQWKRVPGIGEGLIQQLSKRHLWLDQADRVLENAQRSGVRILSYTCPDYPNRLAQIPDAPPILYVKGQLHAMADKVLAIVGTRQATDYGKHWIGQWLNQTKGWKPVVVSGLALGIDAAAHAHALKNGLPTVAVMANGLDTIYPAQNRKLASQILEHGGGWISENPLGMKPMASLFLARNRIIAGLSDVCIVVESAVRGGGMVTADFAFQYDRAVMAVPGSVWSAQSAGPHQLIRLQKAQLLTQPEDIWSEVSWPPLNLFSTENGPSKQEIDLTQCQPAEVEVIQALQKLGEVHIDRLALACNLTLNQLASTLLHLEFQGFVKTKPGKKISLS